MKRAIFWSVMTVGLLTMVLSSPGVARADFFSRAVKCPTDDYAPDGVLLTSPDKNVQLTDVIISAGGPLTFALYFDNPNVPPGQDNQNFVSGFLRRGGNLVSNFSGNVQGQNLRLTCNALNETALYVTIVGEGSLPPPPPE
jgi:hypothetical protein